MATATTNTIITNYKTNRINNDHNSSIHNIGKYDNNSNKYPIMVTPVTTITATANAITTIMVTGTLKHNQNQQ